MCSVDCHENHYDIATRCHILRLKSCTTFDTRRLSVYLFVRLSVRFLDGVLHTEGRILCEVARIPFEAQVGKAKRHGSYHDTEKDSDNDGDNQTYTTHRHITVAGHVTG